MGRGPARMQRVYADPIRTTKVKILRRLERIFLGGISWRSWRLGGECCSTIYPPSREGRQENAKQINLVAAMQRRENPLHPCKSKAHLHTPRIEASLTILRNG